MPRAYPLMCTLVPFLQNWTQTLSPWIVVGICLERSVAVWVPHKVHLISNTKTILIYLCLIAIPSAVLYVDVFYTSRLLHGKYCMSDDNSFECDAYKWVVIVFKTIVPFTIMLACSLLISFKIVQSAWVRGSTLNQSERRNHIQTSFTVVAVSIAFFILMVPTTIMNAFFTINSLETVRNIAYNWWLAEYIASIVVEFLVHLNSSITSSFTCLQDKSSEKNSFG